MILPIPTVFTFSWRILLKKKKKNLTLIKTLGLKQDEEKSKNEKKRQIFSVGTLKRRKRSDATIRMKSQKRGQGRRSDACKKYRLRAIERERERGFEGSKSDRSKSEREREIAEGLGEVRERERERSGNQLEEECLLEAFLGQL